ncbi:MAG: GNAT family N-acetyltransferase [Lachnospiraceae bacterium]|nr:GNAT family N-acetyltransferase [Lachnospiraceae bacterium]
MKIIALKKDQLDYFKGLDPFELLDREDIKTNLWLGAVFERGSSDIPAGLLLGNRNEKDLVVFWLYVAGAFRRRGFAEGLLSIVFQYAQRLGLKQVTVSFPGGYGRDFVCNGDRNFFENHGFYELKKGTMTAQVTDFARETCYSGPSLEDEGQALYRLLGDMEPEEYEAQAAAEEEAEKSAEEFPGVTHKQWTTLEIKLKRFAQLEAIRNIASRPSQEDRAGKLQIKTAGEMSFMEFRQGIEMCMKNGHTGFIENLSETPPDYFDMEGSACLLRDGSIRGLLLVHYEEKEQTIYAELLFAAGEDYLKGLLLLIRFGIFAAMEKYSLETKVILPNDKELHRPLIEKLFGDVSDLCP